MQEEGIILRARAGEIPFFVCRETFCLRMNTKLIVEGNEHAIRGSTPARHFLQGDAEVVSLVLMPLARTGGGDQVPLGHQVRVDVVVRDRAVLVRSRDTVDAELTPETVV